MRPLIISLYSAAVCLILGSNYLSNFFSVVKLLEYFVRMIAIIVLNIVLSIFFCKNIGILS